MLEDTPTCAICGQSMFHIGDFKERIKETENGGEITKIYATLYQCPDCKTVELT